MTLPRLDADIMRARHLPQPQHRRIGKRDVERGPAWRAISSPRGCADRSTPPHRRRTAPDRAASSRPATGVGRVSGSIESAGLRQPADRFGFVLRKGHTVRGLVRAARQRPGERGVKSETERQHAVAGVGDLCHDFRRANPRFETPDRAETRTDSARGSPRCRTAATARDRCPARQSRNPACRAKPCRAIG